jgi:hypothetical protein
MLEAMAQLELFRTLEAEKDLPITVIGEVDQLQSAIDAIVNKEYKITITGDVPKVTIPLEFNTPGYTFTGEANSTTAPITIEKSVGGYTPYGGQYEPVGVVHGGEYVVPKKMVEDQKYSGTINYLESQRVRGYQDEEVQEPQQINITIGNVFGTDREAARQFATLVTAELEKTTISSRKRNRTF